VDNAWVLPSVVGQSSLGECMILWTCRLPLGTHNWIKSKNPAAPAVKRSRGGLGPGEVAVSVEREWDNLERTERLQFVLSADELAAIDDFRFRARMPSRSAAIRELLNRGLAAARTDK
jgi:hypothetical protein